jgi:hypothetical protein
VHTSIRKLACTYRDLGRHRCSQACLLLRHCSLHCSSCECPKHDSRYSLPGHSKRTSSTFNLCTRQLLCSRRKNRRYCKHCKPRSKSRKRNLSWSPRRESHCQSTDAPSVGARRLPLTVAQLQHKDTVAPKGPGYRRAAKAWSFFLIILKLPPRRSQWNSNCCHCKWHMKGLQPVHAA